jgi:hypothetical protein
MTNPKARRTWAEPEAVAAAMYKLVISGRKIPIRLPLGSDSWEMIMADIESTKVELEELKELSVSVGSDAGAESLRSLK